MEIVENMVQLIFLKEAEVIKPGRCLEVIKKSLFKSINGDGIFYEKHHQVGQAESERFLNIWSAHEIDMTKQLPINAWHVFSSGNFEQEHARVLFDREVLVIFRKQENIGIRDKPLIITNWDGGFGVAALWFTSSLVLVEVAVELMNEEISDFTLKVKANLKIDEELSMLEILGKDYIPRWWT